MRIAFRMRQRLRKHAAMLLYTYMVSLVVYEKENSVHTTQHATFQDIASPSFLHFVNISLFMEPEISTRHGLLFYFRNTEVSICRFVVTVGLIDMRSRWNSRLVLGSSTVRTSAGSPNGYPRFLQANFNTIISLFLIISSIHSFPPLYHPQG
jgi:hypothetical protein